MYSFNQLKTALDVVQDELIQHHFYDHKLSKISVNWIPYSAAYGFQSYFSTGEISIPAISKSKFKELFTGQYVSLKDILRHEYAHAFAFTHRRLMKSKKFRLAFGALHDDIKAHWTFDPIFFVSEYAAQNAMEDFAETFMYYLEYSGKLPKKFAHPAIRKKWYFIKFLSDSLRENKL